MNKEIRRVLSSILVSTIVLASAITVFATDSPKAHDTKSLSTGAIKSAYIPSVSETGDNLRNDIQDNLLHQAKNTTANTIITSAAYEDETVSITGSVGDLGFSVFGTFCSISENGNVVAFDAVDQLNNFRVVYCSIEKNISESALYFRSFADTNSDYNTVTKLYLVPIGSNNDYVMLEMFGNEFPTISPSSIAQLPADHQLNLYWYAKEFKPVNIEVTEEPMTLAGDVCYTLLGRYEFQHIGMTYKHYMRYEEVCDIRDVARNGTSSASATMRITAQWIDAPMENECSSTTSTLSLKDVSLTYLTRPYTAVISQMSTGSVTVNGAIKTSFKYNLGVGIKGISASSSLNFTWEPGNNNKSVGIAYQAHTNSPTEYWREATAELPSPNYLKSIGNKFVSNWTYGAYNANSASSANATLAFQYTLDNLLDYTQTQYKKVDKRVFSVNIT